MEYFIELSDSEAVYAEEVAKLQHAVKKLAEASNDEERKNWVTIAMILIDKLDNYEP